MSQATISTTEAENKHDCEDASCDTSFQLAKHITSLNLGCTDIIEIDFGDIRRGVFPDPLESPIRIIKYYSASMKKTIAFATGGIQNGEYYDIINIYDTEKKMLVAFEKECRQSKPQYIAGYSLESCDRDYIKTRMIQHNMDTSLFTNFHIIEISSIVMCIYKLVSYQLSYVCSNILKEELKPTNILPLLVKLMIKIDQTLKNMQLLGHIFMLVPRGDGFIQGIDIHQRAKFINNKDDFTSFLDDN